MMAITDDSWHQGATRSAATDLDQSDKGIKDWRPASRIKGYRKHSWVRMKDNCSSSLAWKSFTNQWAYQTAQWFKAEPLEAWSHHQEQGGTQSIASAQAAPKHPALAAAFPPAPRSTAGGMLTDVHTRPQWTSSGDGASWKQHSSATRQGALAKPAPHQ